MLRGEGTWATGTFRHSRTGTSTTVEVTDCPETCVKSAIRLTDGAGIAQDDFYLEKGTWTLSWWVKKITGNIKQMNAYWSNANPKSGVVDTIELVDGWQRVSFTSTNEVAGVQSIAYIYAQADGEILVTAPKLERGSIPTPWTPALEDVLDRIAKIEQKIGM